MRVAILPEHLFNRPEIGVDEIAVMAALSLHADRSGSCFPSQALLARILGKSRPWVCAVIGKLVELGLLVKQHRYRHDGGERSCLYKLVIAQTNAEPDSPSGSSPESSAYPGTDRDCLDSDTACHAADSVKNPKDQRKETPPVHAREENDNCVLQSFIQQKTDFKESDGICSGGTPNAVGNNSNLPIVPPLNWQPTDADLIYALERFPDADLTEHTEKFINKSRAKGYRYHDLSAAWRSWLAEDESARLSGVNRFTGSRSKHSAAQAKFGVWASVARQASQEVRHAA